MAARQPLMPGPPRAQWPQPQVASGALGKQTLQSSHSLGAPTPIVWEASLSGGYTAAH
jgi:hypothetical protein